MALDSALYSSLLVPALVTFTFNVRVLGLESLDRTRQCGILRGPHGQLDLLIHEGRCFRHPRQKWNRRQLQRRAWPQHQSGQSSSCRTSSFFPSLLWETTGLGVLLKPCIVSKKRYHMFYVYANTTRRTMVTNRKPKEMHPAHDHSQQPVFRRNHPSRQAGAARRRPPPAPRPVTSPQPATQPRRTPASPSTPTPLR